MSKQEDNVLKTPMIHELTEVLKLTKAGQATLRTFDDEVLRIVFDQMMISPNIEDPFKHLVKEALKYSQKNRIKYSWKRCYDLQEAYHIAKDDYIYTENQNKTLKGEKSSFKKQSETPKANNNIPEYIREQSREKDRFWAEWKDSHAHKEINPEEEIRIWMHWFDSEDRIKFQRLLSLSDSDCVFPSVTHAINSGGVDSQVKEILFLKFTFLEEKCKQCSDDPGLENEKFLSNLF